MHSKAKLNKYKQNREKQFRTMFRAISKVFINFADKASRAVNKSELSDLLDKIPWAEFDEDLIRAMISSTSFITRDFSKYVNNLFDYKGSEDLIAKVSSNYMKKYRKNVAKKVSGTSDRVKKSIASIISEGQNKGLTTSAISEQISDKFIQFSEGRARVIARTEVNSTTNNVHEDIALSVDMTKRTWIHTGAGKTSRPHHKSLDLTSVKFKEKFKVGDHEAKHPHDESLPASEVVSCHCFAIYE